MPGKRSDPKKLAAERQAIAESLERTSPERIAARVERVKRSRAAAQAGADAFAQTGEGTMSEAYHQLRYEANERRLARKHPRPSMSGSAVIGYRKRNDPV